MFQTALTNPSVVAGHTLVYNLPATYDAEGHSLVLTMSPTLSWLTLTSLTSLTISPTVTESGLSQSVTLMLSDNYNSNTYTMIITVVPNTPPTFVSALVSQTVYPGLVKTYVLPSTIDVDGDVVTVALLAGGPSYVTFNAASYTLTISPLITQLATTFNVTMRVSDGSGQNDYVLSIKVVNTPPTFPTTLTD